MHLISSYCEINTNIKFNVVFVLTILLSINFTSLAPLMANTILSYSHFQKNITVITSHTEAGKKTCFPIILLATNGVAVSLNKTAEERGSCCCLLQTSQPRSLGRNDETSSLNQSSFISNSARISQPRWDQNQLVSGWLSQRSSILSSKLWWWA